MREITTAFIILYSQTKTVNIWVLFVSIDQSTKENETLIIKTDHLLAFLPPREILSRKVYLAFIYLFHVES